MKASPGARFGGAEKTGKQHASACSFSKISNFVKIVKFKSINQ